LPIVTLGKEHTAKKLSVKRSLPSVFYSALDKGFAECPALGKGQTENSEKNQEKMFKIFF
jgi:hypothetical protein